MSRDELKEIICRVVDTMQRRAHEGETPRPACIFGDGGSPCDSNPCDVAPPPCDVTTYYAVGEEG